MSKALKLKSMPIISKLVLALAILLPISGIFLTLNKSRTEQITLDNYQLKTITDILGTQELSIPITPQIQLRYACSEHTQTPQNSKNCFARQYNADYAQKNIQDRSAFSPQLREINLIVVTDDCRAGFSAAYPCTPQKKRRDWCKQRKEFSNQIWCTNQLGTPITFKPYYPPPEFNMAIRNKTWNIEQDLPGAKDANGKPVRIECSEEADKRIAKKLKDSTTNPKAQPLYRYCRIKYLIEPDIEFIANYIVLAPDASTAQAQEIYKYSDKFWTGLKTP